MDSDSVGGTIDPVKDEPKTSSGEADAAHAVAMPVEAMSRNTIFDQLVTGDADITGLVAYSIYKQNKLDWLSAFEAARKRLPNDAELSSYIIGEGTPRRLATYRHLAESTLAGQTPSNGDAIPSRDRQSEARRSVPTPSTIVTFAIVAFLFVTGFWLAAHFATTGH